MNMKDTDIDFSDIAYVKVNVIALQKIYIFNSYGESYGSDSLDQCDQNVSLVGF